MLIIFSSSFSLAKDNEKITVEEIENIFFNWDESRKGIGSNLRIEEKKSKTFLKRIQTRDVAKCMYEGFNSVPQSRECNSKVIRRVFQKSERGEKRRPGDIFFGLEAIEGLVFGWDTRKKFLELYSIQEKDFKIGKKVKPGSVCEKDDGWYNCSRFKKGTLKKVNKFKKDPSNEKALGRPLIKHIKNVRMVRDIRKKIGDGNYALLGDMLNDAVLDVKKNNIIPELKLRRALLKKYSLIMTNIKKKLDEDNYKSIEKDVSKLSKTFNHLNSLVSISDKITNNVDKAVTIIFETNKLVQTSILNAKKNDKDKLLALSSINFMQSLLNSILSVIPEKYYTEQKMLSANLFNENDLSKLEITINSMMKTNNEIKFTELNNSIELINKSQKSINTSDVIRSLDNLEMNSGLNRIFNQDKAAEIARKQIKDNLDNEILKSAKKLIEEMDNNELSELTKEASSVASEVASSSSVKEATSNRAVDREYGGQNLKKLIGAARNR